MRCVLYVWEMGCVLEWGGFDKWMDVKTSINSVAVGIKLDKCLW